MAHNFLALTSCQITSFDIAKKLYKIENHRIIYWEIN